MDWKIKAKIQNIVSLLPSSTSHSIYYWIQTKFGSLKKIDPVSRLKAGIEFSKKIEDSGKSIIDSTLLEIGTGRRLNIPIAFWLLGANKVITTDINTYLKEELVKQDINYIKDNPQKIEKLFENHIFNDRLQLILELTKNQFNLKDVLDLCCIEYLSPVDATQLPLPSESIDFHTSYTVFEHIPLLILKKILHEGNRVVTDQGLFVHLIDYSDHFSHSDKSISAINFLQFSEAEWNKIAGNSYMYMNRLRHDDYIKMFQEVNHNILSEKPKRDKHLLDILHEGFPLNEEFSNKSEEVIATTNSWFVTKKNK